MNPDDLLSRIKTEPGNPCLYQDLARTYLEAGDEAQARDVVVRRRHLSTQDAEVWRRWGELCETLGMAHAARESYERPLRLASQDSETLYRLAVLLEEVGHYEKSLHYLRKLVRNQPGYQAAQNLLAENYCALGLPGQADALAPPPATSRPVSPPRYFPPSVSEQDTSNFLRLFAGREVGYALQQLDQAAGEVISLYQEAPLTHNLVISYLLGEVTLAAYPLQSDNTSRYAAVSLRLSARLWEANLKNQGYLTYLEEKMRHAVLLWARYARELGLPAYPEDSGARYYRLWFFFPDLDHFLEIKRSDPATLNRQRLLSILLPDTNEVNKIIDIECGVEMLWL